MKIIDKRPSSPEPLLVKDCACGDVVTVLGCKGNYYLVAMIGSNVYGINLEGGGYVGEESTVKDKVSAEVHVTGIEPI